VEFSDTAGLRGGGDTIERAGVRQAERTLADADLIVLVFDAGRPWSASDQALLQAWPYALAIQSKSDLVSGGRGPTSRQDSPRQDSPRGLKPATSALTGEGIDALLRAIADRLVPSAPPPGAAVPFTAEQVGQLLDRRKIARGGCSS